MIIRAVFLAVIGIQLLVNMYLLNVIENQEEENKQYFRKLRRDYDIKLEELKKDIEIRDEIIEGKKAMRR